MKALNITMFLTAGGLIMLGLVIAYFFWQPQNLAPMNVSTGQVTSESSVGGTPSSATTPGMPSVDFYGLVIDNLGSPVTDAEVHMSVWKVARGNWSSRSGPPLDEVTKHVEVRTGKDGRFTLTDERGYMVQILDIRKPGYDWLVDLAWSIPSKIHSDNRFFIYGGGFPLYMPNQNRPAIFPLLRKRDPVATMPSRGGSDQLETGQTVLNEPVKPLVPSTGPGSPTTAAEWERQMRAASSATLMSTTRHSERDGRGTESELGKIEKHDIQSKPSD